MYTGFSKGGCIIVIGKAKRGGSDHVSEGMQGRFVVTMVWCPLVRNEEGHDSSGARVGQYVDPVNRSTDVLVGSPVFWLVRVVRVKTGYGFYGAA